MKTTVKKIKVLTKNGSRPTLFISNFTKTMELPSADLCIPFSEFENYLKIRYEKRD